MSGARDNEADTSSRSARESGLMAKAKRFVVITDRQGMEQTECHAMNEVWGVVEYAMFTGAKRVAIFVHWEIDKPSDAPPAAEERALARNAKLTDAGPRTPDVS